MAKNKKQNAAKQEKGMPGALQFGLALLFISWCAAVTGIYYSRSGLGVWFQNAAAVIRMDKSDAVLAATYETDTVSKQPEGVSSAQGGAAKPFFLSLLLTGVILFTCLGTGLGILSLLKLSPAGRLESIVYSVPLGLGAVAYSVLLLAVLSLLRAGPIIGVMGILFLISSFVIFKKGAVLKAGVEQVKLSLTLPEKILAAVGGLFILVNLLGTIAPQTWYDTLLYHSIEQYYIIHGKLADVPTNIYASVTGSIHMLYLLGLLLTKSEFVTGMLTFCVSLLSFAAVFSAGRRYFSARAGFLAAVVFSTAPLVSMEICRSQIEIYMALFSLLSFLSLMRWNEEGGNWLPVSALFAGLAMSCKYIGVLSAAAIFILLAYLVRQAVKTGKLSGAKGVSALLVFVVICGLLETPWLARNMILKGNPVYPYLGTVFKTAHPEDKTASMMSEVAENKAKSPEEWALIPWNMTMRARTESPLNGPVFLLFVPLAALLFFFGGGNALFRSAALFFIAYYLGWSVLSSQARFLIPALPFLSLALAYAISTDTLRLRGFLLFVLMAATLINASNMAARFITVNAWRVPLGQLSYEDYLSSKNSTYNAPSYRAVMFVNRNLPAGAKVMFWGETRAFPCRRDFIASSAQNVSAFDTWAMEAKDGDELYRKLESEHITHILWNMEETQRLHSPEVFYAQESDPALKAKLADFSTRYLKVVFATKWTKVLEVLPL